MTQAHPTTRVARRETSLRSFTLIELMVVVGIIAVLGGITALAYRGVAKDAKLSSAKNTVMAVLDNARGLAMKENTIVAVVFRARLDGNRQYLEAVIAQWNRQSARITVNFAPPGTQVVDRLVPVPGVPVRTLPVGIKVAGPFYAGNSDTAWLTSTHLPAIAQSGSGAGQGEIAGSIIGVMYAPNGTTITRNSQTDSNRTWVDFDNDGLQDWGGGSPFDYNTPAQAGSVSASTLTAAQYSSFFEQRLEHDECYIDFVPFLAVFDDDHAREVYDPSRWNFLISGNSTTAYNNRLADYTAYVTTNADRLHFNRYTGVAMK